MPTTVITGRDLTLSIDFDADGLEPPKDFDAQASSVVLKTEVNRQTYETLAGRARKTIDENGTLNVSMLADWGTTGGLCAALWTAADTAPDTPINFTFTANGDSWAGQVLPEKPDAGGDAPGALELALELTVVGTPTRTAAA